MRDDAIGALLDSPGVRLPARPTSDSRIEDRVMPQTERLAVWEDEGGAAAKPAGLPAATVKSRAALEQTAP